MATTRRHYVTFDDRPVRNAVGLKLLMLSAAEHAPDDVLHVVLPELPEALVDWARRQAPSALLHRLQPRGEGWSAKPEVLLYLMDQGIGELIWLDADLMMIRNPQLLWETLSEEVLVAAEDLARHYDAALGEEKARVWGYKKKRDLETGLNSAVLRVTYRHRPLIESWGKHLQHELYLQAQRNFQGFVDRPRALYGDQEVLDALLITQFVEIPVRFLKYGPEIIHDHRHFYAYTARDRIRNALRLARPYFVHCTGFHPWLEGPGFHHEESGEYFHESVQLKPYVWYARRYADRLEEDNLDFWLHYRTPFGRLCQVLTLNNPHLQGLGLWALDRYRRWRKRRQ
ncbi:hypothetical protein [Rhodothermus profundi]|uniref:Lipopolysaccharide biosynthesis protein, LPS:glycosyltransferase n=1 Tax=Rhodothermus profundi TaxID=633813 RepID=A0A1M6XJW4_9BACT|nr:hypothetical protein [Rhodothermus profundi]SHL06186.1 hypothetical protein SAMN04488087_2627 [Rhodothermus profundi]